MKNQIKSVFLFAGVLMLVIGTVPINLHAQGLSNISGSFVDIGFGARPVAMGNAYTAVAADEHGVYWNPAGLASLDSYITSFTHTNQLRMIEYNYVAVAAPLPGLPHGAGATIISSGDETMRELSIHLGYAYQYGPVSAGIGLKYRSSTFGKNMYNDADYIVFEPDEISAGRMNQITGDASGFGLDLGLLYKASDRLSLGLMLRDAVGSINWNSANQNTEAPARGSYAEGVPTELIVGSGFQVRNNILVTADFRPSIYSDTDHVVNLGAETRLLNLLALRAGTEQRINDISDERYALGFGLNVGVLNNVRVRIDYAYLIQDLENTQRISLAIQF